MQSARMKRQTLIAATIIALTAACGNSAFTAKSSYKSNGQQLDAKGAEGVKIKSLEVIPAKLHIGVGEDHTFKAKATFSDNTISDVTTIVAWSSNNQTIGKVNNKDAKGKFSAVKAGSVKISATYDENISADSDVTVSDVIKLDRIELSYSAQMLLNSEQSIGVTAFYNDGSSRDVSAESTFQPQKTTVLAYKPTAIIQGIAAGNDIVDVNYSGKTAQAAIEVLANSIVSIAINPSSKTMTVGDTAPFSLIGTFSQGGTLDLTATSQWSSGNAAIVNISNTNSGKGIASAVATGSTTISASYNGMSASAAITVVSPSLLRVEITPVNPSIKVGQSLGMRAYAYYSDLSSNEVTATAVWSSTQASVASFSTTNKGNVLGVASGTSLLSATFNGITASTTITVSDNAPTCLSFTASKTTALVGDLITFTVTGNAAASSAVINGVPITSTPYTRNIVMTSVGSNDFSAYVQGPSGRGDCSSVKVIVNAAPTSCVDANAPSVITFESTYAGKPIGGNYPGLTFSLKGLTELPIVTTVLRGNEKLGSAEKAWNCVSCGGENHIAKDSKSSDIAGNFLLTMLNGYRRTPLPTLIVSYATPVSAASGYLMDIDHNESWFVRAYDGSNALISSWNIAAKAPGTGNGIPTYWSVRSSSLNIVRLEIEGNDPVGVFGFGFDRFSPNAAICNP